MQNPIKSVRVRQNACLLFIINDPSDNENFRIRSGLISQIKIRSKKRWELLFFFFLTHRAQECTSPSFVHTWSSPRRAWCQEEESVARRFGYNPSQDSCSQYKPWCLLQCVQALTFSCLFSFKVTARQLIVCVCMYVHVDQMHRSADPREFRCFQRMWCKILYTKFISSHATVYNQF